ncbi:MULTISPECIES: ABC transporter family substrate-binding protein [unclassified Streptomyces]|uniref:ABC transporter family substrate-binding protein n=1 Tax=unclassified Streptomyces TaxID=2593676 RepID=UPI00087CD8F4|nr:MULTISPECIES: ABC transporter family substrate-binding protein [unclassified Streptomyces]REH23357.1 peptide/nickel transport system substrate-binding protein [Streptomyces sp. 2221.1]SDT73935.1 peptide/nickel transport system substrate-binding protein [Streptomyces sp. 2114.2]
MSHVGVGPRAVMRAVAFLTTGVLAVPALAGCTSEDPAGKPLAEQDVAAAARARISDGGTLRWAVDSVPDTLNAFQSDADATTTRVAQAVLPSMYRMDETGSPVRNPDYLESAEVVDTEPKQVVVYKLNQQAVWSDGREIGAADFAAQWRALSGKDSAYWTARNAGYDRIEKVERGANDLEVKVTFSRPYADWKALFTPLYPKDVTGTPDAFNDGARRALKVSAGPFAVKKVDTKGDQVVLTGNPRWWGEPAKLDEIVLRAVPRDERVSELVAGKLDLAEIDPETADEVTLAAGPRDPATGTPLMGPGGTPAAGPQGRSAAEALRSWAIANGSDEEAAEEEVLAREERGEAEAKARRRQQALSGFELRKSLEPAYTQLALNGAEGPLADERVRRAVARALDREELAEAVLKPLGLPAEPVGSHLALSGQPAYADGSGALGEQNAKEARALLADAGWVPGGPVKKKDGEEAAGAEKDENKDEDKKDEEKSEGGDDGTYIVGEDDKNKDDKNKDDKNKDGKNKDGKNDDGGNDDAGDAKDGADRESGEKHSSGKNTAQGGAPGAYAPKGTAAPAGAAAAPLAKDGKELTLRFVLPSGPGSGTLRTVADRITDMLKEIGIGTRITKVPDESYFKDHIAAGEYDLALYSWPASAFPATDARPIYAKPVPAADGSLNVAQNYTRVGTDQVDQLFDRALATLDQKESRDLLRKADSRIWAAAGSVPLYQRPQLTAARKNLANAGAFGFGTPVYEDMGFLKKGAQGSRPTAPASPSPSS